MKKNLKRYSLASMKEIMASMDMAAYRGEQLFQWLWQKGATDFAAMTNFSKSLRTRLAERFKIAGIIKERQTSSEEGVVKYLMRLEDKRAVETVFIPEGKRNTLCLSTQVGCPLQCRFCATGMMGFGRNLEPHEIAGQIQSIDCPTARPVTNLVLMGMGEPLLNIENVLNAIDIISSSIGLSISQRRVTISTIGILDGIERLLASSYKIKLAISLNFADEDLRQEMMPGTKPYALKDLLKLAHEYSRKKSRITFEYVLLGGVNDRLKDARILLARLRGIPCKINLIIYNPHPRLPFRPPTDQQAAAFHAYLLDSPFTVTLRRSRGQDINAGCGQLVSGD